MTGWWGTSRALKAAGNAAKAFAALLAPGLVIAPLGDANLGLMLIVPGAVATALVFVFAALEGRARAREIAAQDGTDLEFDGPPALAVQPVQVVRQNGAGREPQEATVVWAAIDWSRIGRVTAVTEPMLHELWKHYRVGPRSGDMFAQQEWSTAPAHGSVALLDPAAWALAEETDSEPGLDIDLPAGSAAVTDEVATATVNLGMLLALQGDLEGARAAFERAIETGDPEHAPMGAVGLGVLLQRQGDIAGARAAFHRAIESGHPEYTPKAAASLGLLLQGQGDVHGARAAFNRAIESGHEEHASRAAFGLGVLLQQQGHVHGARTAFERAIEFGHADHTPKAAFCLGTLLQQQGDFDGARAAYEHAIDSSRAHAGRLASAALAELDHASLRGDAA